MGFLIFAIDPLDAGLADTCYRGEALCGVGTTGPLPARDWAVKAGGSSKAAVSTGVHRRRPRRERDGGTVHVGCGSWGWVAPCTYRAAVPGYDWNSALALYP